MYQRYEKLRNEKGVSDYAVSKATGIDATTFSKWKHGKYAPKADKVMKIANYFGVSLDYFYS